MTVLLERRLSVALLPLYSLLLFLFGLRGQHKLLRYLLLRDELGDGTRLPDPGEGEGGREGDIKRERGETECGRLMRGKITVNAWRHASVPP